MKDFHHLFLDEVKSIYSGEQQIFKALPDLVDAAREPKLKEVLRDHLKETKTQLSRLEEIAGKFNLDLSNAQNPVIQAMIKEGHKLALMQSSHEVKDAAIIAAAQCIEHYEIAVYGTLRNFSCILQMKNAENLFKESLSEEMGADKKLTEIAEGGLFSKGVNKKACDEDCNH